MKALVIATLSLALSTAPALAQGKKSQSAPGDFPDAPVCGEVPDAGASLVCRCEAGSTSGSVWGSGPYTADSSICAAAVHSGVIGADGGALQLMGLPGQDSYEATEANGVITSSWGAYGQSFDVRPALTSSAADDAIPSGSPVCDSVPAAGASLVCQCPPGTAMGSVWGSGPYTADSDICTAARHSGVIGENGGELRLVARGGMESYEGTSANGVTTGNWGSYGESFDVQPASAVEAGCDVLPGDTDRQTCDCRDDIGGSVWGSGPYTADSNICTAARHAGVLGAGGGTVTVIRLPGLESYTGSQANGEATAGWGSYDSSIVFDRN